MFVGVLRLTIATMGARSLKEKRKVIRSLKDRIQSRLRLSVAEVGALDEHRRGILAVAAVAGDAARVDELLSAAGRMAGEIRDGVLADRSTEIIAFGDDGRGMVSPEPEDWS
jgi:uncharacterized protein YlxP (DUF503 family)